MQLNSLINNLEETLNIKTNTKEVKHNLEVDKKDNDKTFSEYMEKYNEKDKIKDSHSNVEHTTKHSNVEHTTKHSNVEHTTKQSINEESTKVENKELEHKLEHEIENETMKEISPEVEIEDESSDIEEVEMENIDIEVNTLNSFDTKQILKTEKSEEEISIEHKKDEIGEKNIDSVKYSIGNKLGTSIESMLEKNITDFSKATQGTLEGQGDIEDVVMDGFSGEIELIEKEVDLKESTSLLQSENETQTEELEVSQKEIFKQIKEGIRGNSTSRSMQIMLKPQQLGRVNLNLKFFNNALHINVFVENENVENILRQNLEQIIGTINPMGVINIGSITVSKVGDTYTKNLDKEGKIIKTGDKIISDHFVHRVTKNNYYR